MNICVKTQRWVVFHHEASFESFHLSCVFLTSSAAHLPDRSSCPSSPSSSWRAGRRPRPPSAACWRSARCRPGCGWGFAARTKVSVMINRKPTDLRSASSRVSVLKSFDHLWPPRPLSCSQIRSRTHNVSVHSERRDLRRPLVQWGASLLLICSHQ